jgi:hypothetical protein
MPLMVRTLAFALTLLSACATAVADETVTPTPYYAVEYAITCPATESATPQLRQLSLVPAVVRMTLFGFTGSPTSTRAEPEYFEVVDGANTIGFFRAATIGPACPDAACEEAIRATAISNLKSLTSFPGGIIRVVSSSGSSRGLIVISRQAGNVLVPTLDALRPFVAPVSTATEAAAWASLDLGNACGEGQAFIKATPEGYELRQVGNHNDCDGKYTYEDKYRIFRDGHVERGSRAILSGIQTPCVGPAL